MQFFLIALEKAKSYNAKQKKGYQLRLAALAQDQMLNQMVEWVTSPEMRLYSNIFYFHRKASDVDADNMSKPILDALRQVVFKDDKQVVSRTAMRIDISSGYTLSSKKIPEEWYIKLLTVLNDETIDDIIMVEVGDLEEMNVSFGRER